MSIHPHAALALTLSLTLGTPAKAETTEAPPAFDTPVHPLRGDILADPLATFVLHLPAAGFRALQTFLNAAGFDAGPADGHWGPHSQAALRAYQAAEGLRATGFPDRATMLRAGLSAPSE